MTSRNRPPSRRMASASSPSSSTRREGSSRRKQPDDGQAVSPIRWAGMALVILSIVAAITLAMVSPSEPVDTPAARGRDDVAITGPIRLGRRSTRGTAPDREPHLRQDHARARLPRDGRGPGGNGDQAQEPHSSGSCGGATRWARSISPRPAARSSSRRCEWPRASTRSRRCWQGPNGPGPSSEPVLINGRSRGTRAGHHGPEGQG